MVSKQGQQNHSHRSSILNCLLVAVIKLRFMFLVDNDNNHENNYLDADTNKRPQWCQLVYNGTLPHLKQSDTKNLVCTTNIQTVAIELFQSLLPECGILCHSS